MNVIFKEWLPDQAELGNPGLIEAKNTIPKDGAYEPFYPLGNSLNYPTVPSLPYGGIWAYNYSLLNLYYGDRTSLSRLDPGSGAWTVISASTYTLGSQNDGWSFEQFDNLVIAATRTRRLQSHTIAATSSFTVLSTSGEAPYAEYVGKVGRFVVSLNNRQTTTASVDISVRWSAIDDARNWPTPNTTTATATQSGEQFLDESNGRGIAVSGNDQFALIFQTNAITRMTYVGPPVVFQFDKISDVIGCPFPKSVVQVGGKFYFLGRDGVYVSDGVGVSSISAGKIDRWLFDPFSSRGMSSTIDEERVYGAVDKTRKIIMWGYPSGGTGANTLLIYNYEENRFTWADENHEILLTVPTNSLFQYGMITGFDTDDNYIPKYFVGATTPAIATFVTGEVELNEAGRAYLDGIKPHVESSATAPAIGVRVGYRDSLGTAASFSSTASPNSRTGVANFRIDAKYHRAEVVVNGKFDKVTGLEFSALPSGKA